MKFEIRAKYNIGDRLKLEDGFEVTVIKIKLSANKDIEKYTVYYLLEYQDETRAWENFEMVKVKEVL